MFPCVPCLPQRAEGDTVIPTSAMGSAKCCSSSKAPAFTKARPKPIPIRHGPSDFNCPWDPKDPKRDPKRALGRYDSDHCNIIAMSKNPGLVRVSRQDILHMLQDNSIKFLDLQVFDSFCTEIVFF